MIKTFYVQTDSKHKITDIVEMPCPGYNPVELETPLPPDIMARCYELVGDSIIYRREWDTRALEQEQRLEDLETAIAAVMFGGQA